MPDGERILVKTMDGVQIFNLKTLQEDGLIKAPRNILAAAISPDGGTLAWSLDDNTLQLVQIADGQVVSIMTGHTNMVGKLRFSPSGDRLYSASHDTWVRVWDMEGNQVDAFQPLGADFPSEVLGIGISPDGTQLASVPFDGPVKIWDLATKQLVATLGGGGGFDTSDAVFSPMGGTWQPTWLRGCTFGTLRMETPYGKPRSTAWPSPIHRMGATWLTPISTPATISCSPLRMVRRV